MSHKYILPEGVTNTGFQSYFSEYLSNNISNNLILSISNLLAIDYFGRLKDTIDLDKHISQCTIRIKKYLGMKVITDQSFASVMQLFTIAITPEKTINEDNDQYKELSEDILTEYIIEAYLNDNITISDKSLIRSLIKEILSSDNGIEMMNLLSSNPKLFSSIIKSELKQKRTQKELRESFILHLTHILSKQKKINKKLDIRKELIGKISLATGLVVASSIGLALSGFILPALVLPAAGSAIKFMPTIGIKMIKMFAKKNQLLTNGNTALLNEKKSLDLTKETAELDNKKQLKHKISNYQIKDLSESIKRHTSETPDKKHTKKHLNKNSSNERYRG